MEGEVETGQGHVCVQLTGRRGLSIFAFPDLILSLEDRSSNRTEASIRSAALYALHRLLQLHST